MNVLKRLFYPFRLSESSWGYSICLPQPFHSVHSLMLLPVLSPSLYVPPPPHCCFCMNRDWLPVPSHVTQAARVPLRWKLDTTHPLHLHPTSQPYVVKEQPHLKACMHANTGVWKYSMKIIFLHANVRKCSSKHRYSNQHWLCVCACVKVSVYLQ